MTMEAKRAYLVVGVVAATVSAATAAYVFWMRSRRDNRASDTVEDILGRCHDQVRLIEQRLGELPNVAA